MGLTPWRGRACQLVAIISLGYITFRRCLDCWEGSFGQHSSGLCCSCACAALGSCS